MWQDGGLILSRCASPGIAGPATPDFPFQNETADHQLIAPVPLAPGPPPNLPHHHAIAPELLDEIQAIRESIFVLSKRIQSIEELLERLLTLHITQQSQISHQVHSSSSSGSFEKVSTPE